MAEISPSTWPAPDSVTLPPTAETLPRTRPLISMGPPMLDTSWRTVPLMNTGPPMETRSPVSSPLMVTDPPPMAVASPSSVPSTKMDLSVAASPFMVWPLATVMSSCVTSGCRAQAAPPRASTEAR